MKHVRPDYQGRIVDNVGIIPEDEPVMFFRGHDPFAIYAMEAYIEKAKEANVDPKIIKSMELSITAFKEWQKDKPVKHPDVPENIHIG